MEKRWQILSVLEVGSKESVVENLLKNRGIKDKE